MRYLPTPDPARSVPVSVGIGGWLIVVVVAAVVSAAVTLLLLSMTNRPDPRPTPVPPGPEPLPLPEPEAANDPMGVALAAIDAINSGDNSRLAALCVRSSVARVAPFQGWELVITSEEAVLNSDRRAAVAVQAFNRDNLDHTFQFEFVLQLEDRRWKLHLGQTTMAFISIRDAWRDRLLNEPGPRTSVPVMHYVLGTAIEGSLDVGDNIFANVRNRGDGHVGPTGEEAFYDVYSFEARAGQEFTIVLRGAAGLDVFLAVAKADVKYLVAPHIAANFDPAIDAGTGWFNDDINYDADNYDSCVHIRFAESGTYHIYCTQYERGSFGHYTLSSHTGAPTESERPVTD